LNAGQDPRASLLGVYRPPDILFVRGEGTELVAADGRRYLDFTSGIAVTALGHGSPVVRRALEAALDTGLVHTSNLFRTAPAEELARRLVELTGMDRAFFCNSGAEGVEGALKFARRWARERGGAEKHRIVALKGAFHGRLFGSLAVTDRLEYRAPFEPLMPGVDFADPTEGSGEGSALRRLVDRDRTAAVIVEPIQGEGGMRPLPEAFLQELRALTREREVLLILDEIQCGVGRTGTFLAHESAGIRPDLLVLAKPLAGGLPMGVVLLTEDVASPLQPGDHGTTFGGGPMVATVARAVVDHIARPDFLEGVRRKGEVLGALLRGMAERVGGRVQEVRGRGFIWGVELTDPVASVVEAVRDNGLLLVGAGPRVLRILPPLTATEVELERGVAILEAALQEADDPGRSGAA
jgi:predicted acetylornithine/succinylornithine family transaminase